MASAQYLAEHLAEVPAIVIPTIIGRHDGNGRPGLFDSVIQAAWSFCLALRARGLGTTWVTAALEDEARVKEILGIPDHMTEIVLLPVAWTKGTEFGRAPRHPARAITYFDRFGTTFEHGPGASLRFEDGPGAIAEIDIDAPPAVRVVAGQRHQRGHPLLDRIPERRVAERQRGLGATLHRTQPPRRRRRMGVAVHGRRLRRTERVRVAHVRSRQSRCPMALRPRTGGQSRRGCGSASPWARARSGTTAAIKANPDKEARVLRRRLDEVQANMQRTVEGIKELAEVPTLTVLETYRALSSTATFNEWAGFEVVRMAEGECELRMAWRAVDMGQYSGFLHAGLIAALLDTACGFAANTMASGVLSSHVAVNYLAPAVGTIFKATGRVVKAGRKQIFTAGELHAVDGVRSTLVATATAILVPAG